MAEVTIYHNPRCSKSRQTMELLESHGIEPQIRLYLENPPSADEIQEVLNMLGISARDLIRSSEDEYKAAGLADRSLSEEALINAMAAHPKLIQRPIVIKGGKAALGRPPEQVLEIL